MAIYFRYFERNMGISKVKLVLVKHLLLISQYQMPYRNFRHYK